MTFSNELPGHFVNRRGFVETDRRTKQRNQTFKFGVITCEPDRRILSVVKNISPTGALLELDNALEIPDQFTLTIDSEPEARVCRVAWKKAKQIAVNFGGVQRETKPVRHQQRQNERQERRRSPRRSSNTAGWIRLDGSFATKECKIVDISTAGVRLCVPSASKLPDTFTLLFSKDARGHRVRMVWRRADQIGAKFI
jgi:PilZ domain-containing protein